MTAPQKSLPEAVGAVAGAVAVALQGVPDPCMVAAGAPTSIIDLGLVDAVEVSGCVATVTITLTEPGCPFTHNIVDEITDAARTVDGIEEVEVVPRWAPLWTEARMTPEGRRILEDTRPTTPSGP